MELSKRIADRLGIDPLEIKYEVMYLDDSNFIFMEHHI